MDQESENKEKSLSTTIQRKLHFAIEKLLKELDQKQIRQEVDEIRLKYPDDTREELADRLMHRGAFRTATVGTAAGAIGGPMGLLALAPDIFTLVREQSRLVLLIAFLYGQKPDVEERLREVLAVLAVSTGTTFARRGVRNLITKGLETELAEKIVQKITGKYFAERLPRLIPIVGGIVGGTINVMAMIAVERAAVEYYSGLAEEMRKGEFIEVEAVDADGVEEGED